MTKTLLGLVDLVWHPYGCLLFKTFSPGLTLSQYDTLTRAAIKHQALIGRVSSFLVFKPPKCQFQCGKEQVPACPRFPLKVWPFGLKSPLLKGHILLPFAEVNL